MCPSSLFRLCQTWTLVVSVITAIGTSGSLAAAVEWRVRSCWCHRHLPTEAQHRPPCHPASSRQATPARPLPRHQEPWATTPMPPHTTITTPQPDLLAMEPPGGTFYLTHTCLLPADIPWIVKLQCPNRSFFFCSVQVLHMSFVPPTVQNRKIFRLLWKKQRTNLSPSRNWHQRMDGFDWYRTSKVNWLRIDWIVFVCVSTCVMDSGQKLHPFPEPTPDWSTVDLLPPWKTILPRLWELRL